MTRVTADSTAAKAGLKAGDRIVEIAGKPATGGIESHLRTLSQAQSRLGAAVRVVCVNHRDAAGRDVTWRAWAATPTVEELDGAVELRRVGKRASLSRLEVCPGLLRLGRLVRDWAADVVHLHVPNPTMLLALALAPALRTPALYGHHADGRQPDCHGRTAVASARLGLSGAPRRE